MRFMASPAKYFKGAEVLCDSMETKKSEQIYAFDSLYTTNHIQMLKILLPCLTPPLQRNLALYIKFLELRYTISFLSAHPYVINGCSFDKDHRGQEIPVEDLLPYLTPGEAENIRQLQKGMDMVKQFSNMQKNMEALKGILPEGMDLETLFQSMMSGGAGAGAVDRKGSDIDHENDQTSQNASRATGDVLKNMMQGASSGDILKNMMSDSQKELYEKFNERFRDL